MKKLVCFVMVLGLIVFFGSNLHAGNFPNPGSAPVNVTSEPCCYHMVGYSKATTSGNAGGLAGMNAICQGEFSSQYPLVRMCTTMEVQRTAKFPASTSQFVWVNPTYKYLLVVDPAYTSCANHLLVYDPVSNSNACEGPPNDALVYQSIDCRSWTIDNSVWTGTGLNSTMGVLVQPTCQETYSVACCAP